MVAGVAPAGLSRLAVDGKPRLGPRALSAHRFRCDFLLLLAQGDGGSPQEPRRGRPGTAGHLRQAGHPPARAGDTGRRGGGRGVRLRIGGDHVSRQTRRGRRGLLLDFRGGARVPGADPQVLRQRGAAPRQLLRGLEQRRLQRRLLRVHSQGRALSHGAVHLLPHQ